ncbi:hypothetical protein LPBF_03975 [Flavobacterium crassostreae]|uniref:Uncharacterized protein n=1 Tax=Flavobacterium crassostreae TaxID=1763534 RepID=A0A1B9E6I1_9FLAO|nr:hypothetical protein LPBF_03975 [Flavobacterium crassostreae]
MKVEPPIKPNRQHTVVVIAGIFGINFLVYVLWLQIIYAFQIRNNHNCGNVMGKANKRQR